jgi:hypothetical protein
MKTMGDFGKFGGITYTSGDFHTPGQSGFSGIDLNSPDFITPGTSGLGAMDILSSFLTPELKDAAVTSAKTTGAEIAKFIWQEYKAPIIIASTFVLATLILENIANVKIMRKL